MFYHLIFIIGMLMETGVEFIARILNIFHLKKTARKRGRELQNIFKPAYLKKAYHYIKTKYSYESVKNFLQLFIIFFLIYSGLFMKLSLYMNTHINSPLPAHLAFIGALSFIFYILLLPFSIIDSFFVEKKFGFSTITVKTFIMDNIKVLLLSLILGGGLLLLIFAFILKFQNTWWLWAWVLFTLFSLFMLKIYPAFIAPLFNKFTPINRGELRNKIMALAKKLEFPITRILKNDASKRSRHSNAYFTGMGKNRQIVLFDTLIASLTPAEITGVLAHEIGHYKKKHIAKMFVIQTLITGLSLYLVKQFTSSPGLLNSFSLSDAHYITRFIFALIFINSFLWFLQFFITLLSRQHEFSADKYSAQMTGNPKFLISSLIKLTKENLANPYPHPLYSLLYYSHPPLTERICSLKENDKKK